MLRRSKVSRFAKVRSALLAIEDDLCWDVQLLVVGTGHALRLGEAGDVDAILFMPKPQRGSFRGWLWYALL